MQSHNPHLHVQVESRAPLVSAQLAEARAALAGDLALSDERADQLRAMPQGRLSLADTVRLVVHDQLQVGGRRMGQVLL